MIPDIKICGTVSRVAFILLLVSGCATSGNTGTWERPRSWTPTEKAVLAWSLAASMADLYTTNQMLSNPDNYELNPILGRRPDPLAVITSTIISNIVCVTVAHFNPECRVWLLGGKAGLNTVFAIHNSSLPGGR